MRVAVVIVLALAALVAVGSAAARDPKGPQQRHTAADTKQAKSIGLVLKDFAAGWKAAPRDKPGPPCSIEPDESKLVQTAAIDPTFVWKDGITSVGSEVDIFRTAAEAKRDWQLSTLKVIGGCLLESAQKTLGKKVKVTLRSAQELAAPKVGERSIHYRLLFQLRQNKVSRTFVTELIGFNTGRISVVLHAFSPLQPLPSNGLNALTALLAKRVADAAGGI